MELEFGKKLFVAPRSLDVRSISASEHLLLDESTACGFLIVRSYETLSIYASVVLLLLGGGRRGGGRK